MNQEQREAQHKKDRERAKHEQKHHQEQIENIENKEGSSPRPIGLIAIGFVLTLLVVLSWIFYF